MDTIIEACRESRLLQQGLNFLFLFRFSVFRYTLAQIYGAFYGQKITWKI